jgi:two-component system OmpR family sensor kinase
MSSALGRGWREVRTWLRGVRARLVTTYVLAAVILAVAGVLLFTLTLGRSLRANVDAALQTRAGTLAADLTAGNLEQTDPPPQIGNGTTAGTGLLAFTAVYAPGGRLVDAQPASLPGSPLTVDQLRTPPAAATTRTTRFGDESFRILAQPVRLSDGVWVVVAGQSLGAANAEVRHALFIAVPILLLLVGLGAWLLSGAALKPVDRMRADAQELSEHDLAGRITEPATRDSLNQLARTFNALLDRLHHSLDRQRSLVADAGHELRTPLAVLQTELETAVRPTRSRADLVNSITHARVEVARLAALAEDLLLLAQADGGQPIVRRQLTDVSELLDDVTRSYRDRADLASIDLQAQHSAPLIAELDPVALRRILDNLVSNALRHTPARGVVTLYAGIEPVTPTTAESQLVLRVSDTGPGFPADFLAHAFDRFTRADQGRSRSAAAAGSGLGLAIVETLVRAHAGTVTAANGPGGGASVQIRLPVGERAPGSR